MPENLSPQFYLRASVFPFFPLVALAAAYMGVLNASGVFFLPLLASALFNLASILVGVAADWLIGEMRWGIQPMIGMAIGVVVGRRHSGFLCQLPAIYRQGYRWPGKHEDDPSWWSGPTSQANVVDDVARDFRSCCNSGEYISQHRACDFSRAWCCFLVELRFSPHAVSDRRFRCFFSFGHAHRGSWIIGREKTQRLQRRLCYRV